MPCGWFTAQPYRPPGWPLAPRSQPLGVLRAGGWLKGAGGLSDGWAGLARARAGGPARCAWRSGVLGRWSRGRAYRAGGRAWLQEVSGRTGLARGGRTRSTGRARSTEGRARRSDGCARCAARLPSRSRARRAQRAGVQARWLRVRVGRAACSPRSRLALPCLACRLPCAADGLMCALVRRGWSSCCSFTASLCSRVLRLARLACPLAPRPTLAPPSPRRIQVTTHLWTCLGCPLDRAAAPAARELAAACAIESARVVESA